MSSWILVATLFAQPSADLPHNLRLHFDNETSARCPSEGQVRRFLQEELAGLELSVRGHLVAEARIVRKDGRLVGELLLIGTQDDQTVRTVDSGDRRRCSEVARDLVVALAVALIRIGAPPPLHALVRGRHLTETSAGRRTPTTSAAAPPLPLTLVDPADTVEQRWLQIGVGAAGTFGATPSIAMGAALAIEGRWPEWSIGLESRWDTPTVTPHGNGPWATNRMLWSVVPCYHWSVIGACGVLSAGAQVYERDGSKGSVTEVNAYLAGGVRLSIDIELARWLLLRITGEVVGQLAHEVAVLDPATGQPQIIYSPPPVAGGFGAGLVTRF